MFARASIVVEEIRREAGYGGARVIITGELAKERCRTQIGIGFGDAVAPGLVGPVYPVLLDDLPAPRLRTKRSRVTFERRGMTVSSDLPIILTD